MSRIINPSAPDYNPEYCGENSGGSSLNNPIKSGKQTKCYTIICKLNRIKGKKVET